MSVEITGDLDGALDRLREAVEEGTHGAAYDEANELSAEISRAAPVRTGRLAASVDAAQTEQGAEVTISAPYAGPVEADDPFIRPTVDRSRGRYVERVVDQVEADLP